MSEQQGRRRRIEAEIVDGNRLEAIIECNGVEAVTILADLIVNTAKAVDIPLPMILIDVVHTAFSISKVGAESYIVDLSKVTKPGGEGAP